MLTYKELLAQREELEKRIVELRGNEIKNAIQTVKGLVRDFGLLEGDVFSSTSKKNGISQTRTRVAPIYRNKDTNETWTGRGRPPLWIQHKDREQFRIDENI